MSRFFRLYRALLAESLAIGLIVVLLGLPSSDVRHNGPYAETPSKTSTPTEAPARQWWWTTSPEPSVHSVPSGSVQEQLRHTASMAGAAMERELDRIIAPFVAARLQPRP